MASVISVVSPETDPEHLARPVLARALRPFPTPVRMLDALHLASAMFLRERGHDVAVATYDARMCEAAKAMGLAVFGV